MSDTKPPIPVNQLPPAAQRQAAIDGLPKLDQSQQAPGSPPVNLTQLPPAEQRAAALHALPKL